ncbi:P-loop containing nucleoside triphosphate hydrolase protein [Pelagophyceae sp. CCMP2097]|nr:P-loop containing nucleoside triphosphate hydrolase protein [Pelagophyceae sp. CCMP2097]
MLQYRSNSLLGSLLLSSQALLAAHAFVFKDVSFTVKRKGAEKNIIQDVSAAVSPGRVLAIMGPSGAGKTTLINVLTLSASGGIARGTVTLGGRAVTQNLFSNECYVVPQEDHHWAFLTLRETLQYAAELYLPTAGANARAAAIEAIEVKMGLASCRHTVVGGALRQGLSGGQKRRLSIAVGLLKRPALLFLDEPTSGLDAAAAAGIMVFIRELADLEQLCVVVTIHQPSTKVYDGFDQVLVLAKGRIAYCGAAGASVNAYLAAIGEAVPQFTNPAEFVLDLVNADFHPAGKEDKVDAILEMWRARGHEWSGAAVAEAKAKAGADAAAAEPEAPRRRAGLRAVSVMLRRHSLLSLRDPTLYVGRALVILVGNVFFSVVYIKMRVPKQDQALNRLWLCVWSIGVPNLLGVAVVVALNSEFKSIKREIQNGLCSPVAYLLAKACIELPCFILFAACGLVPSAYGISNFNGAQFVPFAVIWMACLYSFECAAALLAVSFENALLGVMAFMGFWLSALLFGGFLVPGKDMVWPLKIFYYITPSRYGVRSMVHTEFAHRNFNRHRACVAKGGLCYGKRGTDVLRVIHETAFPDFDSASTYAEDLGALLGLALGFKLFYLVTSYRKSIQASRILPPLRE